MFDKKMSEADFETAVAENGLGGPAAIWRVRRLETSERCEDLRNRACAPQRSHSDQWKALGVTVCKIGGAGSGPLATGGPSVITSMASAPML